MDYFKLMNFLVKGNLSLFDYPKESQLALLDRLGEPKDDIERAYKQYLCQNSFVHPKAKKVILNVVGAIIVPMMSVYLLLKGYFVKRGKALGCIIENKGMPEVVPQEVYDKYKPILYDFGGLALRLSDIPFCLRLVRIAVTQPYFVLKAMMHIAKYSYAIRKHSPQTIIRFCEFSFSGTVLTAYCHLKGVKHVNVMHGEKLFNIRDSYFHFDECYVWGEHYVNLFKSLKAEATQFRVALPPSIKIDCSAHQDPKAYADYKYYLAIIDDDEMKSIVASMSFAKLSGKTVKYRPHPRYTDINVLKKYVSDGEIEYPREVPILESISNLDYAVGAFTTVLVQAYFSGKNVIMDDVTFKKEYDRLGELDYILSTSTIETLSRFQR